jgi:hypothetical protein
VQLVVTPGSGEGRARDSGEEVFLSQRSHGFLEHIQQVAERGRNQPRRRILRYLSWRREELAVRRRALPLLVRPGAIEALRRRTVEEDDPPVETPRG